MKVRSWIWAGDSPTSPNTHTGVLEPSCLLGKCRGLGRGRCPFVLKIQGRGKEGLSVSTPQSPGSSPGKSYNGSAF